MRSSHNKNNAATAFDRKNVRLSIQKVTKSIRDATFIDTWE